eukprot:117146-Pyramimonas_sp.AAC.1
MAAQAVSKMAPKRPHKGPLYGPKGHRYGPQRPQDGPRGAEDGQRGSQESPKAARKCPPNRLRRGQTAQERPNTAPRDLQEVVKIFSGGPTTTRLYVLRACTPRSERNQKHAMQFGIIMPS